jgi:hypothetical protein
MNERLAALIFALTGRKPVGFTDYNASEEKKVSAEQVEEPRSIITPTGPLTAQPGDWEVRHEDGNVERLTNEEFEERYQGGGGTKVDKTSPLKDESSDSSDKESASEDRTTGEKDSAQSTATPKSDGRNSSEEGDRSQDDTSAEKGKTSGEKDIKDDELPL